MAAAAGKKEVKVELKFYPMKEMSAKAREFVSKDKDMKKTYEGPVTWSEKGEFDPRKHNKKSLDEEMWYAARMAFKLLANRVDKMAKDSGADMKKVLKELQREFDDTVKDAISACSLKFEEIQSGKDDNKKALKDGKAALEKADGIDFHASFVKPFNMLDDALKDLKTALKGSGGDKGKAFDAVRKSIASASADYDKSGKEAFAAVDFLLKKARALKNDSKADQALKDFGAQIMENESDFDGFVKAAEAFGNVIDDCSAFFKSNNAEGKDVEQRIKDLTAANKVFNYATTVDAAVKKLNKKFKDVVKSLA